MMSFKQYVLAFAILMLLLPSVTRAQTIPGDVTFEVPLNLTQLWAEITKVDVTCVISSDALVGTRYKKINGHVEFPVASGQLVTTARVVVAVAPTAFTDPTGAITGSPNGKPATYACSLSGFNMLPSNYGGGWHQFSADNTIESFRISPTPSPITGKFVW
jgi:hypothetical protein